MLTYFMGRAVPNEVLQGNIVPPYYPVFLDVRGRRCAVIGGGDIGEEKVLRLLEFGAAVAVTSPAANDRVRDLAIDGRLEWVQRGYQPGDLEGTFLAIVADTSDADINRSIYAEARERNVPLNVVDMPEYCTFIAPAIVRRGDVIVAASTGGASPALARKFREELSGSSHLKSRHGVMEYADLAPLLSQARADLADRAIKLNPDHWQACLTDELVDLVQTGKSEEAREMLMSDLLAGVECGCEDGVCRLWEKAALITNQAGISPRTSTE